MARGGGEMEFHHRSDLKHPSIAMALPQKAALFALAWALLLPAPTGLVLSADRLSPQSPLQVAHSYLKATHARDYRQAYRLISSRDQRVLDREGYSQMNAALDGFALQIATRLAAEMEIQVIAREWKGDLARLTVDYKVPAADGLGPLLHEWNAEKLNALTRAQRRPIIGALAKLNKAENRISISGRETIDLIKENGHWKVFLDWASKISVSFDAGAPEQNDIEVAVLKRKYFAGADEPFQTTIRVKNRSPRAVSARIDHRIEPEQYAGRMTMIACGFLTPLILKAGEERELSSAYLLDADFPKNTKLKITYHFASDPLRGSQHPDFGRVTTNGKAHQR